MGKFVYFKVLGLLVALAGIVYVMNHLTPAKVSSGLNQVGLSTGAGAQSMTDGTAARSDDMKVNLCPNRIHAIEWPDGRKIQEFKDGLKLKWQAYNLDPVDMGYMDMEKWLSLHCEVPAHAVTEAADFKPFVSIAYIDGTREALDRAANGLYRFHGQIFDSPDLTQAFEDLITIANLQPLGP